MARYEDLPKDRITKWLKDCDTHKGCSSTLSRSHKIVSAEAMMPKRCIHFRPGPGDSWTITLEETQGRFEPYVCLSHRWAQSETVLSQTTIQNYAARIQGQQFENIDKIFIDSCRVASQCGIDYVWIDSLCIVQNSEKDWEEETLKMASYYQNARFTIGAAIPESLRPQGLFASSFTPYVSDIVRLPYYEENGSQNSHFYVYPHPGWGPPQSRHDEAIVESGLGTRGWVFQERKLSRRIVWFTMAGISLECRCFATDWDEMKLTQAVGWSTKELWPRLHNARKPRPGMPTTTNAIYTQWKSEVVEYSALQFSETDDRIIAISGVASEFDIALKKSLKTTESPECVVGLWIGDIHNQLLWHRVIGEKDSGRLESFPTWSWASYDGSIDWVVGERKVLARCGVEKAIQVRRSDLPLLKVEEDEPAVKQTQKATAQNRADLACNFAAIWICGVMQPVRISGKFQDQEEIKVVTRATACGDNSVYDAEWRTVAVSQAPGIIAGWASLEDPALQDDSAFVRAPLIFALLVSTTEGVIDASFGLGNIYSHRVFNVLYLKPSGVAANLYERAGVGRLVGREVEEGFNKAQERRFILI